MGKDLKGRELGKGIRQRADGRYHARYVDRFGIRRDLYASSKAEIKAKLKEAQNTDKEKKSVKKQYKLKDWYRIWLDTYKIGSCRETTLYQYRTIAEKYILPDIGPYYLDAILPMHIKAIIQKANDTGMGWETQDKIRAVINDMYYRAIENQFAVSNPGRGIALLAEKPDPESSRVVLSVDDQRDFARTAAGTFYYNMYVVALNTGLRPGELYALTPDDIDLNEQKISVTKTLHYSEREPGKGKEFWVGPPKTKASIRTVKMISVVVRAFQDQIHLKKILDNRYPQDGEFADLLFVTSRNHPLNVQTISDNIKKIKTEIDLQRDDLDKFPRISPHTLRHTFATRSLEAGMSPKALQKVLGHAKVETTLNLYVHVTDEFQTDEMSKLEGQADDFYDI